MADDKTEAGVVLTGLSILRQFSSKNHAMDIPISKGGGRGKKSARGRIFLLSPPEETQLVYLQLKKKFES